MCCLSEPAGEWSWNTINSSSHSNSFNGSSISAITQPDLIQVNKAGREKWLLCSCNQNPITSIHPSMRIRASMNFVPDAVTSNASAMEKCSPNMRASMLTNYRDPQHGNYNVHFCHSGNSKTWYGIQTWCNHYYYITVALHSMRNEEDCINAFVVFKQLQMKHFFIHIFHFSPHPIFSLFGPFFFGISDCHENSRAACTLAVCKTDVCRKAVVVRGMTIHLTFKSGNKLKPPSWYKTCLTKTDEFKYLLK